MEHLQKAQMRLNEIILTFIAINKLVGELMRDDNNVKQYSEQMVEIGHLLDTTVDMFEEAATLIPDAAPERIRQLMEDGRFE